MQPRPNTQIWLVLFLLSIIPLGCDWNYRVEAVEDRAWLELVEHFDRQHDEFAALRVALGSLPEQEVKVRTLLYRVSRESAVLSAVIRDYPELEGEFSINLRRYKSAANAIRDMLLRMVSEGRYDFTEEEERLFEDLSKQQLDVLEYFKTPPRRDSIGAPVAG